jgi:hypothetical protein
VEADVVVTHMTKEAFNSLSAWQKEQLVEEVNESTGIGTSSSLHVVFGIAGPNFWLQDDD